MAEGLNRVMLMGNLGADPELRQIQGGQSVLKLRMATSETYLDKDKQRQERTEWHNVVIWGKRADSLARFLTKGSRLFVEGGLRTSSFDDKDGKKVYRTEIVASNVILQGSGKGGERQERQERQERASEAPRMGGSRMPVPAGFGSEPVDDDDLPF